MVLGADLLLWSSSGCRSRRPRSPSTSRSGAGSGGCPGPQRAGAVGRGDRRRLAGDPRRPRADRPRALRARREGRGAASSTSRPTGPRRSQPASTRRCVRADDFFGGPVLVSRYAVGSGALRVRLPAAPRTRCSLRDGRCVATPPRRDWHELLRGSVPRVAHAARAGGLPRHLRTRRRSRRPGVLRCSTARSCASSTSRFADRDVLAYFDSLRPIAPDDIDFRKG